MTAKILVVDDEYQIRNIIATVLEREGYEVYGVGTIKEALTSPGPWDLMLLDHWLPNGKGEQVRKKWADVPVIYMSGYPAEGHVAETFMPKPFSRMQLLNHVRNKLAPTT